MSNINDVVCGLCVVTKAVCSTLLMKNSFWIDNVNTLPNQRIHFSKYGKSMK